MNNITDFRDLAQTLDRCAAAQGKRPPISEQLTETDVARMMAWSDADRVEWSSLVTASCCIPTCIGKAFGRCWHAPTTGAAHALVSSLGVLRAATGADEDAAAARSAPDSACPSCGYLLSAHPSNTTRGRTVRMCPPDADYWAREQAVATLRVEIGKLVGRATGQLKPELHESRRLTDVDLAELFAELAHRCARDAREAKAKAISDRIAGKIGGES